MRKIRNCVLYFICVLASISSPAQKTFQSSFGTKTDETPMAFIQTSDKGFLLLGSTVVDFGGGFAAYLVKIDSMGNKIWSKLDSIPMYTSVNEEQEVSLIQTNDKGYLMCLGGILMKIDSLGNTKWALEYTTSINKVMEVPGGYVIAGHNGNSYYTNAIIMKIDTIGNILWTSNELGDKVFDMMQLGYDSCFYIIASFNLNRYSRIVKMDKNGNPIWSKYIMSSSAIGQIEPDPDGKSIDAFLSFSPISSTVTKGENYWFVFDTSGIVKKAFSFPVTIYNPFYAPGYAGYDSWAFYCNGKNNSMIFTVAVYDTTSQWYNYCHLILFKADSMGNIKWSSRIGGQKTEYPAGVLQTKDGDVAVFGATLDFSAGEDDFYLIKTDSLGNTSCNQDTFHVNNLTPITLSLDTCDFPFPKLTDSIYYIPTITPVIMKDTSSNDCICHPPHAAFYFNQYIAQLIDSSTWATKWYWNFGDGTYDSTIVSPRHLYKNLGLYNVCLTVKNACGIDSVCQVINYTGPGGMPTIANNNSINIYPNPSSGNFKIHSSVWNAKLSVVIYNILGERIYEQNFQQQQDNSINLSSQPEGIYLYRLTTETGQSVGSGKLIIQK